jgi:hypothetical protein
VFELEDGREVALAVGEVSMADAVTMVAERIDHARPCEIPLPDGSTWATRFPVVLRVWFRSGAAQEVNERRRKGARRVRVTRQERVSYQVEVL